MNVRMKALADAGVSIWLDDLSRERLHSGNLAGLIADYSVSGVTTNPTIFAAALTGSDDYAADIAKLGQVSPADAIKRLWSTDVAEACDLFRPIYDATGGYDGRVSIEVEPGLAHDTDGTIAQAAELHRLVDRENVLIKIPATVEGLPAITETLARGISVNVTLIFSVERYQAVMDAFLDGLERAAAAGLDLSKIHSVASVFVSRIDSEVDKRLTNIGTPEALALTGKAAIANARVAFAAYEGVFGGDRFEALAAHGANKQRPLWASTGTKNPSYPDTLYVSDLVADGVVNTMPEKTLMAFADHGEVGATMAGTGPDGVVTLDAVDAAGVDLDDVMAVLEDEGLSKFQVSWDSELVASVVKALSSARA